jgi:hypothetical protein
VIKYYVNNILAGTISTPDDIYGVYTEVDVPPSRVTLDKDDLAAYYRLQLTKKIIAHREKLEKVTTIQVNGSPHTIHTNLEAIAKLSMRASMRTDGFWMDVNGQMFAVSTEQFTQMMQQIVGRGDILYGWQLHHIAELQKITDPEAIKNYDYKVGWA